MHDPALVQFLLDVAIVRALVVVDSPEPGDQEVLLVEVPQLVVQVILAEVLDKQKVGEWEKEIARREIFVHFIIIVLI